MNQKSSTDNINLVENKNILKQLKKIIIQSLKSFAYGYSFKTIFAIILNFKKIKKNPSLFMKLFFSMDQIKPGLFLGTYCLTMKLSNMILNKYTTNRCMNSLISGAIGGVLSVNFITKNIRAVFSLYVLSRAIDMVYQEYIKKKYFKNNKYDSIIAIACLLFVFGYIFTSEPGLMPKSMIQFFVKMANEDQNEKIMHCIYTQKVNNHLKQFNIEQQDPIKLLYSK